MDNLLERFNADLANDLGNLFNRCLPLLTRYTGGRLPSATQPLGGLAALIEPTRTAFEAAMAVCDYRGALQALWELVRAANKFLDERQPWSLARAQHTAALHGVLYEVLDTARCVALGAWPVLPRAAAEMWRQLGLAQAGLAPRWQDFRPGGLPGGLPIGQPRPIFPRVERSHIVLREERPQAVSEQPQPYVSLAEFARLDLRAARVVAAEKVAGADKLLKLMVDLGEGAPRPIVAGLAPRFQPQDLVGKMVVVVANLEPATIRGVESQGMLLAAGEREPVALVVLEGECAPGTKVR
jgi:methionyl-tRNA synthetase